MAGFRKAKAEQAAVKMGIYGLAGSGKSFTSLLIAEGLAGLTNRRVAYVDTERGTDFYCKTVPERTVHPEAFDFDAMYGRSITDILEAVRSLDPAVYGVVVIDSISHVWDAAMAAYKGKKTSIGTIPLNAWHEIKRPYKELMTLLLSSPIHVIICGRQKNVLEDNADGEMTKTGVAMRAEGETQYEPHICIRMEATKASPKNPSEIMAIIEKDRTGVLQGKIVLNPNFDKLIRPILPLLGDTQAAMETEEETGQRDAEAMVKQEAEKTATSERKLAELRVQMEAASLQGKAELDKAMKTITPAIKKTMLPSHVAQLREFCLSLANRFSGVPAATGQEVTA